jgi:hypothetical protein
MNTDAILALVEEGLDAMEQIIATIRGAKAGMVDPQTALAAIMTMTDALAANDAAADAALDAKFPG